MIVDADNTMKELSEKGKDDADVLAVLASDGRL